MAVESTSTTARKRGISLRTAVLVVAAIVLTVFAMKNWAPVEVWPLGNVKLIVVIVISFVLGALIGWLFHSITARPVSREP